MDTLTRNRIRPRRTLAGRILEWLGAAVGEPSGSSAELDPVVATWHWIFCDEAGVAIAGPPLSFSSQPAAEDWLRESFEDLLDLGINAVTLVDGERTIYGPMSLEPDDGARDGAAAPR